MTVGVPQRLVCEWCDRVPVNAYGRYTAPRCIAHLGPWRAEKIKDRAWDVTDGETVLERHTTKRAAVAQAVYANEGWSTAMTLQQAAWYQSLRLAQEGVRHATAV